MRKLTLVALFTSALASYGQLTNAILSMQDGQFGQAKKDIDKYMLKEKSATDVKGWYYKGNIYEGIAFSKDTTISKLESQANAIKIATEAYNKVLQLENKPDGQFSKEVPGRLEGLWGSTFNEGIKYYNENNSTKALDYMTLANFIKPNDTLTIVNGAAIAIQAQNFAYAKESYTKFIEIGYKTKKNYSNLYYIVKESLKDKDASAKVLAEARKLFPTDSYFMNEEINNYIAENKSDEAIAKLNEVIKNDPSNAVMYYYNLGLLYKQTNKNDKAKESFQSSLAVDPNYESSNFMMGFMLIDEGDATNKKINAMNVKDYNTSGKALEAKRDNFYKSALPYLEKSYSVTKDASLKGQLNNLYSKLKLNKKID